MILFDIFGLFNVGLLALNSDVNFIRLLDLRSEGLFLDMFDLSFDCSKTFEVRFECFQRVVMVYIFGALLETGLLCHIFSTGEQRRNAASLSQDLFLGGNFLLGWLFFKNLNVVVILPDPRSLFIVLDRRLPFFLNVTNHLVELLLSWNDLNGAFASVAVISRQRYVLLFGSE